MANISNWLKKFEIEKDELIEAIVVGVHDSRDDKWDPERNPLPNEGRVISRELGLSILDLEYDNGFGMADCYAMYAWTKNWVLFIGEYDGATQLSSIPRHPTDCNPCFGGLE